MPTGGQSASGVTRVRELLLQHLLEHDCLVVQQVASAIDERDVSLRRCIQKRLHDLRMSRELLAIAPLEFLPSPRIVSEPLPQLGAGCELFWPAVDVELVLLQTTWPEAIDKAAFANFAG